MEQAVQSRTPVFLGFRVALPSVEAPREVAGAGEDVSDPFVGDVRKWEDRATPSFDRPGKNGCPRLGEHIVKVFVDHYNSRRPHRSLGLVPPNGRSPATPDGIGEPLNVRRRDRLGGLLHEYDRVA
jgi:hypothetical protein